MPTPSIFASSIRALTFSFICLSFTLSTFKASAQCGGGTTVILSSQADVEAFIATYCTDFQGNLRIQAGDITSLIPLASLTSVGGNLVILFNGNLSSVAGLESLTSVGGNLTIDTNSALSSVAGLAGLTSVGGDLFIGFNPMLGSNGVSDYCGLFTLLDGGGLTGSYSVTGNNTDPTQAEIIANGPCPCTNITCYADTDNDTFGDPDNTTDDTCECGTGFVENGDDCNDNDASINDINTAIYTHEGSCYATLTEAIAAAGNSGTVEINVSVNLQTANTVQPEVTIAIQDGVTVTNSSLLSNGGTITLLGTAQFVNGTAGTYSGGGTFDGDFVNNGTIQIGN